MPLTCVPNLEYKVSMIYWLFSMLIGVSLFAQSITSTSASPNGSIALYQIDPKQRAMDIINMFNTFNGKSYNTNTSRIALQTTRNSLINWLQSITPTSNYTLLIVGYGGQNKNTQYVILPVEQITEVIYSSGTIIGGFSASATSGILPIFEVNLLDRANDIIQVVNSLLSPSSRTTYNTNGDVQVALQTSLTGSTGTQVQGGVYAPVTNGLISDVQSVSLNSSSYGTLLLVTYAYGNNNTQTASISVGTEQIYGINFYPIGPP